MRFGFYDDYSEGAHPEILEALKQGNSIQQPGYGVDEYCRLAAARLVAAAGRPADVHFVSGATQGNLLAMAAMLLPYQAVIAPESAHIAVHETGAVEATGHKVVTVACSEGKLTPAAIDGVLQIHTDEHMVMPKAVFLTQATELGTVYEIAELAALCTHARAHNLWTYIDGARLAVSLAALPAGLRDVAATGVDMMLVGGTKNGALFGEALLIFNAELAANFRYHMKQRGALLAKSRFLGLQFARFFDDDNLWLNLGAEALRRAQLLADGLRRLGADFLVPPQTNQLFVVLPTSVVTQLEADFGFHRWAQVEEGRTCVRLVCSWATPADQIEGLLERLRTLLPVAG